MNRRNPGTLDDFRRCPACNSDHKVIGKVDRTPVVECAMFPGDSALRFYSGFAFLVTGSKREEKGRKTRAES